MYRCATECSMSDSLDRVGYNEIPGAERRLPVKQQMWLDSLSLPSLPTSWQSCHSAWRRMTDRWGGLMCRAGDGWTTAVRRGEAVTWPDTWSHSSVLSKQNSLMAEASQMSTVLSRRWCDWGWSDLIFLLLMLHFKRKSNNLTFKRHLENFR